MSYRETDANLSREQRVERLEDAVAKNSTRRTYETLKIGIQAMLTLIGLGVLFFGLSFLIAAIGENRAVDAADEISTAEFIMRAQETELEVQEAPLVAARAHCSEACSNVGMSIQRARVIPDRRTGDHHFMAASCSCAAEDGRVRTLWNDLVSPSVRTRRACSAACQEAGMGLQRAIIQDGVPVACGCVSPSGHRTLWDDRNRPTCAAVTDDDVLRCELTGYNSP